MSAKPSVFDKKASGTPNSEFLEYFQSVFNSAAKVNAIAKRVKTAITADASAGLVITDLVPIGSQIIDVQVIATAANTAGTVTLRTNAASPVAITDAMVCAVDKVVVRAGTIDDAYNTVTANGLQLLAGGTDATATRAIIVIDYV
jgi:hypothetical protein